MLPSVNPGGFSEGKAHAQAHAPFLSELGGDGLLAGCVGRGAGRREPVLGVQVRGDGGRLGYVLEVRLAGLADGLLVGTGGGETRSRAESFQPEPWPVGLCRARAGAGLQPGAGWQVPGGTEPGLEDESGGTVRTGEPEHLGVL